MPTSPRYGFDYLEPDETVPAEAVNEALERIESGGGHFILLDRDLLDPTALTPSPGDTYFIGGTGAGAWTGHDNEIAYRLNTAWIYLDPLDGFTSYIADEPGLYLFESGVWNLTAAPSGSFQPLDAELTAIAGLTSAANKIPRFTGSGTADLLDFDTDATLAANSNTRVASQAAAKAYVDAKVAGLSWKQAVRVATTANGTLASAFENGDTVDGVTLATGDRILIKNQSSGAENGIYVVAASGAPTRATDADAGAELVNATVYVSEGTTNADTQWTCTNNATITVGSTSLTFTQINTGSTPLAVAADYRTGTDASKALTADAVWDAAVFVALTDGATVTPDFAAGLNFTWTIGGNRTLANPSNAKEGQTGCIQITQDGTGTRLISTYGSNYRFAGGTDIVLSTAAGAIDLLFYQVLPGGLIFLSAQKAIAA